MITSQSKTMYVEATVIDVSEDCSKQFNSCVMESSEMKNENYCR